MNWKSRERKQSWPTLMDDFRPSRKSQRKITKRPQSKYMTDIQPRRLPNTKGRCYHYVTTFGGRVRGRTNVTVMVPHFNLKAPIPLAALRSWFIAARLLGLWVRIPRRAWMSLSCGCCVLLGSGLCVGLITRPEESYGVWCVRV
jgi:hypothetical protein